MMKHEEEMLKHPVFIFEKPSYGMRTWSGYAIRTIRVAVIGELADLLYSFRYVFPIHLFRM